MPLWRVATAPDDLDVSADALVDSSDDEMVHIAPTTSLTKRTSSTGGSKYSAPFLIQAEMPVDINKNTNWFSYPGVWSMYVIIVGLVWLLVLASAGCSMGDAWVIVNTLHFVITFYLFHWVKGSPFTSEDQGRYGALTWWEQMDSGRQLTRNRKFMTIIPVALFLVVSIATREEEHASSILSLNTVMVFILVIAKLPMLHKIRILGINS